MKVYYFSFDFTGLQAEDSSVDITGISPVELVTGQPLFNTTAPVVDADKHIFRIPENGPGSIATVLDLALRACRNGHEFHSYLDVINSSRLVRTEGESEAYL